MKKPTTRHPRLLLISIITIISLAFSITTPAFAQKDNPGGGGQGQGQGQEKNLLKLFERLQAWKTRQELQLEQARTISTLFAEYLKNSDNLNTTELQLQLDLYNKRVDEAQGYYDLATSTLATHFGISADGKMYSLKSTRQMVKVASQSLGKSHRLLTSAARELHKAFLDWQSANNESLDNPANLELASP